jgi:UDP-glucose 4-epimerase
VLRWREARLKRRASNGRTKRIIAGLLRDLARANPNWRIAVHRYFNPAGAHESGRIGEAPHGSAE